MNFRKLYFLFLLRSEVKEGNEGLGRKK